MLLSRRLGLRFLSTVFWRPRILTIVEYYEPQILSIVDEYHLTESEEKSIIQQSQAPIFTLRNPRCVQKLGSKWIKKNPYGRTGLGGKGDFKKIGPNIAIDPVITRCDDKHRETNASFAV